MQTLNVKPISGTMGGLVTDFNLDNLSDEDFNQVANALWKYQVLAFKNQALSIESHKRIGTQFGPLHTHPAASGVEDHPEILKLLNQGKSKNITQVWHSDVSCEKKPPSISILRAIQLPEAGGDTQWANQYEAYERLTPAMQTMLNPLKAVHSAFKRESLHPVVRTHPETSRKSLYVNGGFTRRFEGMTDQESRPLIDFLVSHGSSPDLTMRYSWDLGDVVMWDNRCVMHYAIHDYENETREMHRVTVEGEVPV